jgi:hypothetical protein
MAPGRKQREQDQEDRTAKIRRNSL